uniref:Right handed beta helix domain-containing protein n=1 Tax=Octactis speculum TaxID=3111310 RepID=A0A7S2FXQ3_9STRA|mmetsp:Transcript_32249/g.43629  ORF Transcript_32249/g.43629 Transcript_32249/m.43629 type:complete len:308 (+) Transcript_32249:98-1021(+)
MRKMLWLLSVGFQCAAALQTIDLTAQYAQNTPTVLNEAAFARLAEASIRAGRALELKGRTVLLNNNFKPKGALHLMGPGRIDGTGHSVFQLGGRRQRMSLTGVEIRHLCVSDDRREVGAAIFALGNSRVDLANCSVSSLRGYGVWIVQRGSVTAKHCLVSDCGRSGIVSFGDGSIVLDHCHVSRAAVHGVCVRGRSSVDIIASTISDSGTRGIYAYHNATLRMRDSTVTGTQDPSAHAVQVEALRSEDTVRLLIEDCRIDGNRGGGLLTAGNVVRESAISSFAFKEVVGRKVAVGSLREERGHVDPK